jgi:hypothetical protein
MIVWNYQAYSLRRSVKRFSLKLLNIALNTAISDVAGRFKVIVYERLMPVIDPGTVTLGGKSIEDVADGPV